MQVPQSSVMTFKSYQYKAKILVRDYLLADSFIPYTSVLGGIFMCKMVRERIFFIMVFNEFGSFNTAYDLTQLISSFYFKGYSSLTKIQRIEWNNRGVSSAHAIFITTMSLYLVFFSDLFSDDHLEGLIIFRSSHLSNFALGVSVGYFITDLAMIFWAYPSLGGMEYVLHHLLSVSAVAYAMFSGEGQLYTYMVLISETTTPGVNLRWFLDTAGMKRSNAYLVNGVLLFLAWVSSNHWIGSRKIPQLRTGPRFEEVARIFLFFYLFYHVYHHYEQVEQMHIFGYLLVFVVPFALAIMNMMWFGKILKGLRKTWAKRQ